MKFKRFDLVPYTDTKFFGKNQRNRNIKPKHLQDIKKQCLASFDGMPPIIINETTYNVIDGQHRLQAYWDLIEAGLLDKDTLMKVMFVEIPVKDEIQAIIDCNAHTRTWNQEDYISSYTKGNIDSYIQLEDWCETHSLTSIKNKSKYRYGAAIIKGKNCGNILKDGDFKLEDGELEEADKIHAELIEIIKVLQLRTKGAWIESLAIAWHSVRDQHPFKTWLKELKAKKRSFMKLPKSNNKDWNNIFALIHLSIDKKESN